MIHSYGLNTYNVENNVSEITSLLVQLLPTRWVAVAPHSPNLDRGVRESLRVEFWTLALKVSTRLGKSFSQVLFLAVLFISAVVSVRNLVAAVFFLKTDLCSFELALFFAGLFCWKTDTAVLALLFLNDTLTIEAAHAPERIWRARVLRPEGVVSAQLWILRSIEIS